MTQIAPHKPPQQKQKRVEIPKLRAAARGAECMMQMPGICNHDTSTTVLAHSNGGDAGRGTGYKGHDYLAVNLCSACHDFYDGRTHSNVAPRDFLQAMFDAAWPRQVRWWLENGYLS